MAEIKATIQQVEVRATIQQQAGIIKPTVQSLGPQGVQGPEGPAGPQGNPGPAGPSGEGNIYSVLDYGGVGDDSTDDTLAVQAAIDAAHDAGGGSVYLPGRFRVTDTINLYDNITLFGDGMEINGIHQVTADKHGLRGDGLSSVQLHDIYFQGNGSGSTPGTGTGKGLYLTYGGNGNNPFHNVKNVMVRNFGSDGVYIQTAIVTLLEKVYSAYNGGNGFFSPEGGTSTTYVSCWARQNALAGYKWNQSVYQNLSGCAADNNGCNYQVIDSQSILFAGCGSEGALLNTGINNGFGWYIDNSSVITLEGCWITDNRNIGVWVTNGANAIKLNVADNSPNASAVNFIKSDAGTNLTIHDLHNSTANDLAEGTYMIVNDGTGGITIQKFTMLPNKGSGKVLTSDADGNGTWVSPSDPTNPNITVQGYRGVNTAGLEFEGSFQANELELYEYLGTEGKAFNIVRLPFEWYKIQPTLMGELSTIELDFLKNEVDWARSQGLNVILDLHNYGRRRVYKDGGFTDDFANGTQYIMRYPYADHNSGGGYVTLRDYGRGMWGTPANPVSPANSTRDTYTFQIESVSSPADEVILEERYIDENNRYALFINPTLDTWSFRKYVSGVAITLASGSKVWAEDTDYVIVFDIDQATSGKVNISIDGTPLFTTNSVNSDPALAAGFCSAMPNGARLRIKDVTFNVDGDTTSGGVEEFIVTETELPIAAWNDLWERISNEFKNDTAILGYDHNEPHDMPIPTTTDNYSQAVADANVEPVATNTYMIQNMIDTIRANGDSKWIVAESDHYANAHRHTELYTANPDLWVIDPLSKVIFSGHYYLDDDHSGIYADINDIKDIGDMIDELTPVFSWAQSKGVPYLLGETGWPDNDEWDAVGEALYDLADQYSVWITYWAAGVLYDAVTTIQPEDDYATDKHQMLIVERHLGSLSPVNINDLGNVVINAPTEGQVLTYDDDINAWVNEDAPDASPGGSDSQIQYNNGGAFGGSNLTYNDSTGEIVFNDSGADDDFRMEGDTETHLFMLDASQDRVGIGTDNPQQRLHIKGQGNQTSILIETAEFNSNDDYTQFMFGDGNHVVGSHWGIGMYLEDTDGITINDLGRSIDFRVEGDTDANLLFLDGSTDRVGLGTSTPAEKLEVVGNFAVRNSGNTKSYRFRTSGSDLDLDGSGSNLLVSIYSGANFTGSQRFYMNLSAGSQDADAFGNWRFKNAIFGSNRLSILASTELVVNDDAADYDFRVEGDTDANLLRTDASTDRVGIGTATPTEKLDVVGNAKISGTLTLPSPQPYILIAASTSSAAIKSQASYICDGTGDQTEIQAAIDALATAGGGSIVVANGDFITSATITLKSKVNLIGMSVDAIIKTNGAGHSLFSMVSTGANELKISNLGLQGIDGHVFDVTTGGTFRMTIERNAIYQSSADHAIWYHDSPTYGTLHLRVIDNDLYCDGASRSVPAWYMKDSETFGNTNTNWFQNNLCTYGEECDDQPFFYHEGAIDGDYVYGQTYTDNIFELCLGGAFDLRSTFNSILRGNTTWLEGGEAALPFISLSKSSATGALPPTANSIEDNQRYGGILGSGVVDIELTGNCRQTWVKGFRCSPDAGAIDGGSSSLLHLVDISPGTTLTNIATAGKMGYFLHAEAGQTTPADGETRYFGGNYATGAGTVADRQRLYIPCGGTIKKVILFFWNSSTLGTTETSTVVMLLNNSGSTTISTGVQNNAVNTGPYEANISVDVSAGDYIEFRWTAPTWATNPTNVRMTASIFVET